MKTETENYEAVATNDFFGKRQSDLEVQSDIHYLTFNCLINSLYLIKKT